MYIVSFRGPKVKAPGIFMPSIKEDTMKIEKLPSGSYRVRKMYQGKTYSVTFNAKPTQKAVLQALSQALDKIPTAGPMTFGQAAAEYVSMKRNVLSPKTVKEYTEMPRRLPEWFVKLDISEITQVEINKLVNELAASRAPKTVRNYHGVVSAILGTFRPEMKLYTKLPAKIKSEPYTPSQEDVRKILEDVHGTEWEIPITLACYGMRRSEICALTPEDIDGDVVHINKALVQNERKEWVIKTTKTTDSTRDIIIPMDLADKIRKQGYVFRFSPNRINKKLQSVEQRLGIPNFSLHKLRHYFASQMSAIGVPEADVLRMGGWRSDHVMKSVYRHSMMDRDVQAKRAAAAKLQETLFS